MRYKVKSKRIKQLKGRWEKFERNRNTKSPERGRKSEKGTGKEEPEKITRKVEKVRF
jgi:hypothetical protein